LYVQGGGTVVQGLAIGFHTEVFPLFWMGGLWRELGVGLDAGTGNITGHLLNPPAADVGKPVTTNMDSGANARVCASLFYEGLRFWKAAVGPYVAFDYSWSPTLNAPLVLLGVRTSLYLKAPKLKK